MPVLDPASVLSAILEKDHARVVRLWRRRLAVELHEVELTRQGLGGPLVGVVSELARLLRARGSEALRLWPESVRAHGVRRYEDRFDADDLVREFKALHQVLLRVCTRRHGQLEPALVEFLAELCGEGAAAAAAAYSRVLRTEEVRFREAALVELLLHRIEVGLLVADADGTLSFATPPVGRLLGVPARALLGLRTKESLQALLRQLRATHPGGTPFRADELPWVRVLRDRVPVRDVRMVVRQPPLDTEVVLEMAATPLLVEGSDELSGVVQTLSDRTEAAHHEHELSEAYSQLRRLQARLLQRSRTQALGQLASGAAHALNNQLNVMRLRLQRMKRGATAEDLEVLDRTVGDIAGVVARLQAFVVSRADEVLGPVDLDAAVREALELARPELAGPPEPVEVALQLASTAKVRADAELLRELVVHLLLAARDRMSHGGTLQVSTRADAGAQVLTVRDSGPALSPAELAQLFEPLAASTHRPQLQLLLAVGRGQVDRWGGQLWCEGGEPGAAGVRFVVRLQEQRAAEQPSVLAPVAQEAASPSPAPASPHVHPRERQVLVVDDDVDNAQALAEVLEAEGFEVKVAHSGEAALAAWDRFHFDAALLDALMPAPDGWALARTFRERSPEARIAIVTGADVRGQSRESLALVDAVFRKPLDLGALDEFLTRIG
jgi:two-component system cell cycle sensor histidine kinase/response regulator CckA